MPAMPVVFVLLVKGQACLLFAYACSQNGKHLPARDQPCG